MCSAGCVSRQLVYQLVSTPVSTSSASSHLLTPSSLPLSSPPTLRTVMRNRPVWREPCERRRLWYWSCLRWEPHPTQPSLGPIHNPPPSPHTHPSLHHHPTHTLTTHTPFTPPSPHPHPHHIHTLHSTITTPSPHPHPLPSPHPHPPLHHHHTLTTPTPFTLTTPPPSTPPSPHPHHTHTLTTPLPLAPPSDAVLKPRPVRPVQCGSATAPRSREGCPEREGRGSGWAGPAEGGSEEDGRTVSHFMGLLVAAIPQRFLNSLLIIIS